MRYEQNEQWLSLQKTVDPEDIVGVKNASTVSKGNATVDFDGQARNVPPQLSHLADDYKKAVLDKPHHVESEVQTEWDKDWGSTPKALLAGKGRQIYMVKPYHEKIRPCFRPWMKHHILGWAEMANQAMYHAGDIGELHQKVHLQYHNGHNGTQVPTLVIHMDPETTQMFRKSSWQGAKYAFDARRVGLMDFLTNNMDRHEGNLLVNRADTKLLAIDHGRNFQYLNSMKTKWEKEDGNKVFSDAIRDYLPEKRLSFLPATGPEFLSTHYRPVFDWWKDHSDDIAGAFENHIKHIRNAKVRAHIQRNFYARKKVLDDIAAHFVPTRWHKTEVPIYLPAGA